MEDNNVYVNIKINTDGVKFGTKEVSSAIARATQDMSKYGKAAQASCDSAANAFIKQNQAVANAAAEVEKLTSELEKAKSTKVKTSYLTDEEDALKTLEAEYSKLENQKLSMENAGKQDSTKYQDTLTMMRQVNHEIETQKNLLAQIKNDPRSYTNADTSALEEKLSQAKQKLAATTNNASLAYQKFGNTVSKVKEKFKEASKTTIDINKSFKKGFTTILKYGFGLRSLYVAWRKLRQAMIEGFKTLAKEDTGFNKALSGITTQLNTLKNSFAAAFAPLVTAVAPIIETVLKKINALMQSLSQFIALISGGKTFKVATEKQVDYADSLEKTGGAAKKAKKYLSGLDEIATFTEKDSSGGGGGGGNAFADMAIDNDALKKFEKLKELANKIKDLFLAGFKNGLGDWETRVNDIKKNFEIIKDALRDIFTDPRVISSATECARKIIYAFGQIVGALVSIGLTIAQNLVGGIAKYLDEHREYIKDRLVDIFDITGEIAELCGDFAAAFAYVFEAFGGENGQQFTANIIAIFANAFVEVLELVEKVGRDILDLLFKPFIDNADAFREALDKTLGWMAELAGLVKDIITDLGRELNIFYDNHIKPSVDKVVKLLTDLYAKILEGYNEWIAPTLNNIAKSLRDTWTNHIKPVVSKVLDIIGDVIEIVVDLVDKYIRPKMDAIKPILAAVSVTVESVWNVIKGVIDAAFDVIGGLLDFIGGFVKAIKLILEGDFLGAWQAVSAGIDNCIKGINNAFISMINGIIEGINVLIRGLNKLKIDPPDWAKSKLGIGTLGFNIPELSRIPALANGAVIPPNAPFLATLGDQKNGNNFEAPEGLLRQVVREESGSGSYQFTAMINRRVLFDEIISEAKVRQSASGHNPFEFA